MTKLERNPTILCGQDDTPIEKQNSLQYLYHTGYNKGNLNMGKIKVEKVAEMGE